MNPILKEGAIFIADSHFNIKNQEFKTILEKLEKKELDCSQIFLMGDNFDFLCYEITYFKKINKDMIELLNRLSNSYEIVYLEGNHDYNLQKLFPKIKVIKREEQPFILDFEDKYIALSHGDNYINGFYDLYCKIIRNSSFLNFLNFLDINFFISKKIEKALIDKNICHNLDNFKQLVDKRMENYSENLVVEGHYHQCKSYKIGKQDYINIPSLVCQKSYTVFMGGEFLNKSLV